MNEPNLTDWLTVAAAFLTFFAAVTAVQVARKQLRGLRRDIKLNSFVMLLQLEAEMTNRKMRVEEAAVELFDYCDPANKPKPRKIEAIEMRLNGCVENWLNSADRLAYCILKGYLKAKEYETEYAPYFYRMVTTQPQWFQGDTTYTNVITLCRKWGIVVPVCEKST